MPDKFNRKMTQESKGTGQLEQVTRTLMITHNSMSGMETIPWDSGGKMAHVMKSGELMGLNSLLMFKRMKSSGRLFQTSAGRFPSSILMKDQF